MPRNLSNVEDWSGKENNFVPKWISEIESKNANDFSFQPNVVDVFNIVMENAELERVLESHEELFYRP